MTRTFFTLLTLLALAEPTLAQSQAVERTCADDLARMIDTRLQAIWQQSEIKPAPVVSDDEFLRRVSLDLIGRIPTVANVRSFVADERPDKRSRVVNEMVASAAHTRHMATYLRRSWLPQTDLEPYDHLARETEEWIAAQLQQHRAYDETILDLITVRLHDQPRPHPLNSEESNWGGSGEQGGTLSHEAVPETFVRANGDMAPGLAANATRAFLGINLECAQCHDHPFARWSQDQFWQTAAFFVSRRDADAANGLAIAIPDTDRTANATLLNGETIEWPRQLNDETGRRIFAEWMTADDNPYFARNAVNHLWAKFFGAGLIEPLDDLTGDGERIDDQLLQELGDAFIASGYDLQMITRAIVLSDAYQRSAVPPWGSASAQAEHPTEAVNVDNADDIDAFARVRVRALNGEQLYDSLRTALGLSLIRDDLDSIAAIRRRQRFAKAFLIDRAAEAERSILQSLELINGEFAELLARPEDVPTVMAVANAPFLTDESRLDALFMACLSRPPTVEERHRLLDYLDDQAGNGVPLRDSLADILWALLNSVEFNTIH